MLHAGITRDRQRRGRRSAAPFTEVDELTRSGIEVGDRLVVSDKAHVILPHQAIWTFWRRRAAASARLAPRRAASARPTRTRSRGAASGSATGRPEVARTERPRQRPARNHLVHDSTMDWKPVFEQLVAHGERLRLGSATCR
jgi:hypothetical protein